MSDPREEMTPTMRAALTKLEERAQAVIGMDPGNKDPFVVLEGDAARETLRRTLLGYVEDEDMAGALAFVATMQMGVVLALAANPTIGMGEVGVQFGVAQTFLAGVLYERERVALRRLDR